MSGYKRQVKPLTQAQIDAAEDTIERLRGIASEGMIAGGLPAALRDGILRYLKTSERAGAKAQVPGLLSALIELFGG